MQLSRVAAVAAAVVAASLFSAVPAGATTTEGDIPAKAQKAPRTGNNYVLVSLENANVPNFQRRTVMCPAGMKVVGGGAEARGTNAILVGSFPTDDRRGWIALGRQPGFNDVGISVFAICAR